MTAELPLDELERLEREATPGRWEAVDQRWGHHHFQFLRAPECIVKNNRGPSYATEILSDEDYDTKSADLKFIAAAKAYTRPMIAEIRDLTAQLAKCREECARVADGYTKDFELLLLDLVEPAEHHTNPTSPQIGMLNRIASNSQSLDGILKWARVDDNVKEAIAEAVRLLAAFRAFALSTGGQ